MNIQAIAQFIYCGWKMEVSDVAGAWGGGQGGEGAGEGLWREIGSRERKLEMPG